MTCELIPIELTDEQKGQVCGVLSVGCDWQTAANFVGCSLIDIRRVMRQDPQFAASVHRAEAGTELSHMRTIQQAAKDPKNCVPRSGGSNDIRRSVLAHAAPGS